MSKSVLTKREKQVFDLLVLNKSTDEIAKIAIPNNRTGMADSLTLINAPFV